VVAILASLAVVAVGAISAITAIGQGAQTCTTPTGSPDTESERAVPAELLPLYHAAEQRYRVPWSVLAAINKIETDFGRDLGPSSAGAVGWMQVLPATWRTHGVDADRDGRADPANPADAIFSAAAYLQASGASEDLRRAVYAYNHADWYVDRVLSTARRYADQTGPARCTLDTAAVKLAPGANLPGQPLAPETVAFLARIAALYGGRSS